LAAAATPEELVAALGRFAARSPEEQRCWSELLRAAAGVTGHVDLARWSVRADTPPSRGSGRPVAADLVPVRLAVLISQTLLELRTEAELAHFVKTFQEPAMGEASLSVLGTYNLRNQPPRPR